MKFLKSTIANKKTFFIIAGGVLLIAASLVLFFSCTAGVNVGEANKVLTSFSIKFPDGFDYTCRSNEPIEVVISALDQDGNIFSWSGTVNISATNTSVTVSPTTVDITDGTATVTLRLNHEATEALTTYIKVLTSDVVTQVPAMITVNIAAPQINIKQGNTNIVTGGSFDGGTAVLGYFKDIVFTIENLGNIDLELTNTPAITKSGDSEFSIVSQPSTTTIAPDSSTTFTVRLTPGAVTSYSATITTTSNDPETLVYQFTLNGSGIEHDIIVKQGTTPINPDDNYDFGDINENETSSWVTFTIENISSETINISSVGLTSGDTDDFSIDTTGMDYTLSSGETTTFNVRFNPASTDSKSSTLTIASDSVEGNYEFNVIGNGTYPEINIKQDSNDIPSGTGTYSYGDVGKDTTKPATFTIENLGDGILKISNISLTSGDINQFNIDTSGTNFNIAGGSTTTFIVNFSPASLGTKSATVNVSSNDQDESNYTFSINGKVHLEKIYGTSGNDEAKSVAVDSNGNIYVVGYGNNLVNGSSGRDWWIKKFDSNFNEVTTNWDKKFDSGGDDVAYSVAVDSNDNVYVVGYGSNLINGSSGPDWWIKKFNSNGTEDTTNWNKKFHGNNGRDFAYSVAIDSFNNVYVVGSGYNLVSSSSYDDWWIKKFNSNGTEDTTNWNKVFNGSGTSDHAYSVAVDSLNNVYVVGSGNQLINSSSTQDWWIKKFNSSGTEDTSNWNKKFDGNTYYDEAKSIVIDSNNNVYIAGYGSNLLSVASDDWWIKKFSSNGTEDTTNWNKMYDDGYGFFDSAYSVTIDSNDNIYVVGTGYNLISSSSSNDWWLKKFNSSGTEDTINWNKKIDDYYGDSDIAYSVAVDSFNNVYVVGYGTNLISDSSGKDWWIKKFSP